MDKLLKYLNSLGVQDQQAFASKCDTTVGYLRKAVSKGQLLSAELCVLIETESKNLITRKELCPGCWRERWPELSEKEGA